MKRKIAALIPVRGGSKGIIKNIKIDILVSL